MHQGYYSRRQVVKWLCLGGILSPFDWAPLARVVSNKRSVRYALARMGGTAPIIRLASAGGVHLPMQAVSLQPDDLTSVLTLTWDRLDPASLGSQPVLRLGLASNLATFQHLEVAVRGGSILGTIDLALGSTFQVLPLAIPPNQLSAVLQQGVEIRAKGTGGAVQLFVSGADTPPAFCPHLLLPGQLPLRQEFLNRMASRASLSLYGWQEGCVLDGLAALSQRSNDGRRYQQALEDHLTLLFPKGYLPKPGGIETTSCFAQLALHQPDHPALDAILAFWQAREDTQGGIHDGPQAAAEGNYTVAWPLAVLARERNRPKKPLLNYDSAEIGWWIHREPSGSGIERTPIRR